MIAIEREAEAWAVRLASGDVTAEDGEAFKRWCRQSRAHATAFVRARAVWQAVAPASALSAQPVHSAPRQGGHPSARLRAGRRAFLGGTAAALVGWLAVRPPLDLWPAVTVLAADYRTATGEQRELALDGGVLVQMNTQTQINLRDGAAGGGFELVSGEAEILAPGNAQGDTAPLRVKAGAGIVAASGARFNIRHTGRDACVTCLSGDVLVSGEGSGARVTVPAGAQVTYGSAGLGEVMRADADEVTAWRRSLLVFNQTPLATVIDEVNRYRPGKIVLTSRELGKTRVQASLSTRRLDDLIALIRDGYGVEVTHLPGGIVLLGRAAA